MTRPVLSNSALSRVLVCALLLALSFTPAAGQQTVDSAMVTCRIEDSASASIARASITVISLERGQKWSAVCDDEGRCRFLSLPVGRYRLEAEHPGFVSATREFTLSVGQVLDLEIPLPVAGLTENVDITSDVPIVETARTQVAGTISPQTVDALPLNGRNYLDLALLVPGVSRTNTGSNQRFAETSAVPGTGLSVAGQRNLNNGFLMDGISANDDAADLSGTFFSQEVIREFQVVTSGGIAEFGRASSGIINIVSQSGTADWRGRVYGFFRNQRLDARNPLAVRKDQLTQSQYGASLGGPIISGRTFLFTNFEQTRRNDSLIITIDPSAVSLINQKLASIGYAARIETGIVPSALDTTNFFAKVDHLINPSNQLAVRYSLYDVNAINSRTVGGLNAMSRGTNLENTDQTVAVSNVSILNTRSINEARFQFTRSRLAAPVNDEIGPAINIAGTASFGTATFSPLGRDIDLLEVSNNLAVQRGKHSFKGGADFLHNRIDILFPGAIQGVYTFSTLASFLNGTFGSFQQAFGEPAQFQSNPNLGLFIQDEWRPRRDFTINAGLRYDAQFLPDPIETDANNIAPRIGVAWAPGDNKTVFRASYGIYFDRIPLRATSNALQRDGSKYLVVQLAPGQPGAPVFPDVLSAQPSQLTIKPNVTRIDPSIDNAYGQQASLQIERELSGDASVSVGYLYLRGQHLIVSRNQNVPRFPASAGVPNLGRPNPDFGNIGTFESSGDSYYHGLVASFNKRASDWAAVRVSYTLSKAIDNAGNFFFSTPQNNFNLRDDRGLSDNDQRHRLAVSGWIEAPRTNDSDNMLVRLLRGTQLSYLFTYSSNLPFNVLTGRDDNFDTNFNDRPGVGRNTGRGFDFASLDLRLSRKIRFSERYVLEVMAESFNSLNRQNLQIPIAVVGPRLGRASAASDPRQIQFGMRFSF